MKLPTSPFLQDKFFSDSNHSVEFLCVIGSALAIMQGHIIMPPKKKKKPLQSRMMIHNYKL